MGCDPVMSSTLVKELFFVELITVSLVSKGTRPPSEEVLLRSVLGFFSGTLRFLPDVFKKYICKYISEQYFRSRFFNSDEISIRDSFDEFFFLLQPPSLWRVCSPASSTLR